MTLSREAQSVASPNGAGASVAGQTVMSANSIFSDKPIAETAIDYVTSFQVLELIICFVLGLVMLFAGASFPVKERLEYFRITGEGDIILDPSNSRDFDDETISDIVLVITCVLLPLFVQLGLSIGFGYENDGHNTLCIYMIGFGITCIVTGSIKRYCGVLRPNFYDACGFSETTLQCTGDASEEEKFRRSFPSGHASLAFCGMTLLAMYLRQTFANPMLHKQEQEKQEASMSARKRQINLQRSLVSPSKLQQKKSLMRLKGILCYVPLMYAFFVASSRVADDYHFPADIVAGSIIGVGCATFTHELWYPSNNLHVPITT